MKYIRVDEAPEKLKANEMVIVKPNFVEEIASVSKKRGVKGIASIRSIRDALMVITGKYDNTINPYHIILQRYENLLYKGDEGFAEIILRVIKDNDLPLLDKAVEFKILNRDPKVDTVFYVSDDLEGSKAFIALGFHMGESPKTKKKVKKEDVV